MFAQLFPKSRYTQKRLERGPLAEDRRRYLRYRAAQQMAPVTLRSMAFYTLAVAKTLRLADRPGELITYQEIDAAVERWVHRKPTRRATRSFGHARKAFWSHAIRWLRFLGRLQLPAAVPRPYAREVTQYSNYQLQERGLSPHTVAYSSRTLHEFLGQVRQAGLRLKGLRAGQVDELLAQKIHEQGYARRTIKRWADVLRVFLRFAEDRHWCRPGLAAAIMAPRVFRQESLPVGPSWQDVQRLLAAAEGPEPVQVRDRALLMLLAVYGLRAGEVTTLCVQDFDWERELLHVLHGKSWRPRTYPLCRPVGDAVLRYLQQVRPQTERREVFWSLVAPFRPLTTWALGSLVQRRLRALKLTLPHYGPHALRHACATHLLAQGLSLKEIGDHLGHRSPDATRIYAKVDLTALRAVADFSLEGLL